MENFISLLGGDNQHCIQNLKLWREVGPNKFPLTYTGRRCINILQLAGGAR